MQKQLHHFFTNNKRFIFSKKDDQRDLIEELTYEKGATPLDMINDEIDKKQEGLIKFCKNKIVSNNIEMTGFKFLAYCGTSKNLAFRALNF